MADRENHVKQDEWRYTASNSKSRTKIKRARSKAKRAALKHKIKTGEEEL